MAEVPTYTELLRRVEELEEAEESGEVVAGVLDEVRMHLDATNAALAPIIGSRRTEDSPPVVDAAHDALEAFEAWLAGKEKVRS